MTLNLHGYKVLQKHYCTKCTKLQWLSQGSSIFPVPAMVLETHFFPIKTEPPVSLTILKLILSESTSDPHDSHLLNPKASRRVQDARDIWQKYETNSFNSCTWNGPRSWSLDLMMMMTMVVVSTVFLTGYRSVKIQTFPTYLLPHIALSNTYKQLHHF